MNQLLRIDSSSRFEGSHSRQLGDYFQTAWLSQQPRRVIVRDIVKTQVPYLSDLAIAGFYTPEEQRTPAMQEAVAISDELIAELQSAEALLLSVPMYNFSIPATLKAWIDQVVRIGKTFSYDGTNFAGLVTVKSAYIICTYGSSGYVNEGEFASLNFVEPYLQGLLGFLGISQIQFFHLQGTTGDPAAIAASTEEIKRAIDKSISLVSAA